MIHQMYLDQNELSGPMIVLIPMKCKSCQKIFIYKKNEPQTDICKVCQLERNK